MILFIHRRSPENVILVKGRELKKNLVMFFSIKQMRFKHIKQFDWARESFLSFLNFDKYPGIDRGSYENCVRFFLSMRSK